MTRPDIRAELDRLRVQYALIRRKRYRRSRLDRFKGELLELYRAGARTAELQR